MHGTAGFLAEDCLLHDLVMAYRIGRRRLLLAGGAQMLVAQLAATALIYTAFSSAAPPLYSLVLIEVVICVFTSAFCYSYGPLAWLIPTGDGPLNPLFAKDSQAFCQMCMLLIYRTV